MKKTIIILILVLVAVYIALTILGRGDEYAAEKLFYRAIKINKEITINPDVAPPKMLASVERTFQKILKKYPDTKTAKITRMALAEFYVAHEKYDKALPALDVVINTEGQNAAIMSKAHFFKGIVHEKQGEWDEALKELIILRDEYTDTTLGLQVPLYIARYYAREGSEAEEKKAYDDAVLFYEKLETDYRGKILGYASAMLLRQAYMNLSNYEQAGRVVEGVIDNYPSQQAFIDMLPHVDLIFVKTLKRPEKAIEIYNKVIEKAENEGLIKFLKEQIEKLEAK